MRRTWRISATSAIRAGAGAGQVKLPAFWKALVTPHKEIGVKAFHGEARSGARLVLHSLTANFWPRLGTPRSWRKSTRKGFVLLLPIALPLWVAAILLRSILILLGVAALFVREFWSAPSKRRVSYYAERSDDLEPTASRIKIRRGIGGRFFQL
jgi:hypothetical protein